MKRTILNTLPLLVTAVLLAPLVAFADAVAPGFDFTDPGVVAKTLLDAVMNKQWGIVVSLAITAAIAMARKWVPAHTKAGKWFRTKLGAIITNFSISLGGAFLSMFLAGAPFSFDLVVKALSVALAAAGGWTIFKNVTEAINEKKASDAGVAAATNPVDTINQ